MALSHDAPKYALIGDQGRLHYPPGLKYRSDGLVACFRNRVYHASFTDRPPPWFSSITFSRDGEKIFTCDEKGRVLKISLLNNERKSFEFRFLSSGGRNACCIASTQGGVVVGHEDGALYGYVAVKTKKMGQGNQTEKEAEIKKARVHETAISAISAHPDRPVHLTASRERILLWDSHTWHRARALDPESVPARYSGNHPRIEVLAVRFVAAGTLIAALFNDNSLACWHAETFTLQTRLPLPTSEGKEWGLLTCFAASENGEDLVVGGSNAMLYLWNVHTETLLRVAEMPASANAVLQVEFSFDNEFLFVLGDDGRVLCLKFVPEQCQVLMEVACPPHRITCFAVGRPRLHGGKTHFDDVGLLAVAVDDSTLQLWDLARGKESKRAVWAARRTFGMPEDQVYPRLFTRSPLSTVTTGNQGSLPASALNWDSLTARDTAPASGTNGGMEYPRLQRKRPHQVSLAEQKNLPKWKPLYKLINLDPQSGELNIYRLRKLVEVYGEFPAKYRVLIWRFLLSLPENFEAFSLLNTNDIHDGWRNLEAKHPLRSQRLLRKMKALLSALAHWCPLFGEADYVPGIIFPFVALFGADDLGAFEISAAVLLWWCGPFYTSFPDPPVKLLVGLRVALSSRDQALLDHLEKIGANIETICWRPLKTLLTEILTRQEWLKLWDNLFSCPKQPTLLLASVLAFVIYHRRLLLTLKQKEEVATFVSRQHAIQMANYIDLIYMVHAEGLQIFKKIYQDTYSNVPWPLPKDLYPEFQGYPRPQVDYQIRERERIAADQQEEQKRRDILYDLTDRIQSLKVEQAEWEHRQRLLLQAETRRRDQANEQMEERLLRNQSLEQDIKQKRIARIVEMETAARKTLELAEKVQKIESERFEAQLTQQARWDEFQLKIKEDDQVMKELEHQADNQLTAAQTEQERLARVRRAQDLAEARRHQLEMEERKLYAAWDFQEREVKARAQIQREKKKELASMNAMLQQKQDLDRAFLAEKLQREAKIAEVDSQRRLRLLAEEMKLAKEEELMLAEREATAQANADQAKAEEIMRSMKYWRLEKEQERMNKLREAQQRYEKKNAQQEANIKEMERNIKQQEFERMMVDQHQSEVRRSIELEKDLDQQLAELRHQERGDQVSYNRKLQQQEEEDQLRDLQEALIEAEERILNEEKEKFQKGQYDDIKFEINQMKNSNFQAGEPINIGQPLHDFQDKSSSSSFCTIPHTHSNMPSTSSEHSHSSSKDMPTQYVISRTNHHSDSSKTTLKSGSDYPSSTNTTEKSGVNDSESVLDQLLSQVTKELMTDEESNVNVNASNNKEIKSLPINSAIQSSTTSKIDTDSMEEIIAPQKAVNESEPASHKINNNAISLSMMNNAPSLQNVNVDFSTSEDTKQEKIFKHLIKQVQREFGDASSLQSQSGLSLGSSLSIDSLSNNSILKELVNRYASDLTNTSNHDSTNDSELENNSKITSTNNDEMHGLEGMDIYDMLNISNNSTDDLTSFDQLKNTS